MFILVQNIRNLYRLPYAFPLSFLKTLVHLQERPRGGAGCPADGQVAQEVLVLLPGLLGASHSQALSLRVVSFLEVRSVTGVQVTNPWASWKVLDLPPAPANLWWWWWFFFF